MLSILVVLFVFVVVVTVVVVRAKRTVKNALHPFSACSDCNSTLQIRLWLLEARAVLALLRGHGRLLPEVQLRRQVAPLSRPVLPRLPRAPPGRRQRRLSPGHLCRLEGGNGQLIISHSDEKPKILSRVPKKKPRLLRSGGDID